jgi:hypothetical protein
VNEQEHLDEELAALGRELRRLPTPMPPGGLVSRVRRRAHLDLAGRAEERFNRRVLVFLLFFSWTVSVFSFLAVRLLSGESLEILGSATTSTLSWSVGYFVSAWISVAAVLVLLAFHVRKERTLA